MYLRYGDLSWESAEGADETVVVSTRDLGPATRARRVPKRKLPIVRLNGIQLHAVTEEGCIRYILDELDAGRGGVVVTPNLDHLRRCMHDMRFAALVAEADLVVADGMPLIWASRLQGTPLPERVAGSDLVSSLSAAAAERDRSVFLLGGLPGTAEAAAQVLKQRHPRLRIVGTYCPPFGFDRDDAEIERISKQLREAAPDIVYVALGSPKQELLIERVRPALNQAWWLGVGNSFSFLCGQVKRAPLWMQKRGLEWVHRLLQEPRRLFKRYIVLGIPFATKLFVKAGVRKAVGRRQKAGEGSGFRVQGSGNGSALSAEAPHSVLSTQHSALSTQHSSANGNGHPEREREWRWVEPLAGDRRGADASGAESDSGAGAAGRVGSAERAGDTDRARRILDLPLDDHGSVMDHWLWHAGEVVRWAGLKSLPVRVLVNREAPEPATETGRYDYGTVHVERDHSEYRGTGGVLGDLAVDYADDDLILVGNAAQILLDPLAAVAEALHRTDGDIALVSHQDGTPSGVMLMACKTLRRIARDGFVDLKEQALPAIAAQHEVRVVQRRRPTAMPIRSLADYIVALRRYHGRRVHRGMHDPLGEDWKPTFAIVEPGATVDPLARLHDAVVLRGGCVEAGAVLVRSVVCAGGVVRKDRTAVDQLVTLAAEARRRR